MPKIIYKTKDGLIVPGATTILGTLGFNKQPLMWWAWNEGMNGRDYKATKDIACDAGTLAHTLIEAYIRKQDLEHGYKIDLKNVNPEIVKRAKKALTNFKKWAKMVKFKVVGTEVQLVHDVECYGGTLDCVAIINGELSLFDWKSSDKIYFEYLAQVVAYRDLWNVNYPKKLIKNIHLLQISKEVAGFTHKHWDDVDHDFPEAKRIFLNALDNYTLKKSLDKKLKL